MIAANRCKGWKCFPNWLWNSSFFESWTIIHWIRGFSWLFKAILFMEQCSCTEGTYKSFSWGDIDLRSVIEIALVLHQLHQKIYTIGTCNKIIPVNVFECNTLFCSNPFSFFSFFFWVLTSSNMLENYRE